MQAKRELNDFRGYNRFNEALVTGLYEFLKDAGMEFVRVRQKKDEAMKTAAGGCIQFV